MPAAAAAETVALVLDETSPIPDTQQDVTDLVMRLRSHIMRLTARLRPPHGRAVPEDVRRLVDRAHALRQLETPDEYMGSRVYLVRLAEVTGELAQRCAPTPGGTDADQRPLAAKSGGPHAYR